MEYFFRALYFAVLLAAAARLLNHAMLVRKKPYDFAVNVTFGTIAGAATLQADLPLWAGTAAIAALTAFAWAADVLAVRVPRVHDLLAGRPLPLIEDGRPVPENLARAPLTRRDLASHLREMKIASLGDVEFAALEPDGKIGVVPKRSAGRRDAGAGDGQRGARRPSDRGEPRDARGARGERGAPDHPRRPSGPGGEGTPPRRRRAALRDPDAEGGAGADPGPDGPARGEGPLGDTPKL